jgi:hypothetical protein
MEVINFATFIEFFHYIAISTTLTNFSLGFGPIFHIDQVCILLSIFAFHLLFVARNCKSLMINLCSSLKIICFQMHIKEDLLCKLLVLEHHETFYQNIMLQICFIKGIGVSKDGNR